MGMIRHDAIIVTCQNGIELATHRQLACDLGLDCSEIVCSKMNGYQSFMIAPDGSKIGWPASDAGGLAREAWVKFAKERDEVDFIHVCYGGDISEYPSIEAHNDEPEYQN